MAPRRDLVADYPTYDDRRNHRLPVLYNQWRTLEELLTVQAREALRSAEAAYAAGNYSALDLLESEMMLLEVRTSAARILTDYLLSRVELDRAVARPMSLRGTRREQ